jgi:hypothetical protein
MRWLTKHKGPLAGNVSLLGNLSFVAIVFGIIKFWLTTSAGSRRQKIATYQKLKKELDDSKELAGVVDKLEAYTTAKSKIKDAKGRQLIGATQKGFDNASDALRKIPLSKKLQFAALIELVALHAKSKTFSYELANYEFGDIARKCWFADAFWEDLEEDRNRYREPLWSMYKEFIARTQYCNRRLNKNPKQEIKWIRLDTNLHHYYLQAKGFTEEFAIRKPVQMQKGGKISSPLTEMPP